LARTPGKKTHDDLDAKERVFKELARWYKVQTMMGAMLFVSIYN